MGIIAPSTSCLSLFASAEVHITLKSASGYRQLVLFMTRCWRRVRRTPFASDADLVTSLSSSLVSVHAEEKTRIDHILRCFDLDMREFLSPKFLHSFIFSTRLLADFSCTCSCRLRTLLLSLPTRTMEPSEATGCKPSPSRSSFPFSPTSPSSTRQSIKADSFLPYLLVSQVKDILETKQGVNDTSLSESVFWVKPAVA